MKTLYSHSAIDVKNNEFESIEFNVLENELDEFDTNIVASTYLRVVHRILIQEWIQVLLK
jgi:hypothetical protein